jgi:hypothetical protein
MRYSEISSLPSSPEEAENAMLDLISVYRSKDEASIPMPEILSVLHNQGFDANARWVMDKLQDKSGVKRITPQEIILQQDDLPDSEASDDEAKQSEDKVAQMAAKAAKKGVSNAN